MKASGVSEDLLQRRKGAIRLVSRRCKRQKATSAKALRSFVVAASSKLNPFDRERKRRTELSKRDPIEILARLFDVSVLD